MAGVTLVRTRSIAHPEKPKPGAISSDWGFQFENPVACANASMHDEMAEAEEQEEQAHILPSVLTIAKNVVGNIVLCCGFFFCRRGGGMRSITVWWGGGCG